MKDKKLLKACEKTILQADVTGTVQCYSGKDSFGLIRMADKSDRALPSGVVLRKGEVVKFDIAIHPKGIQAVNVTKTSPKDVARSAILQNFGPHAYQHFIGEGERNFNYIDRFNFNVNVLATRFGFSCNLGFDYKDRDKTKFPARNKHASRIKRYSKGY